MRTVLTTVGTSLLTNAKRHLQADNPSDATIHNYMVRHPIPSEVCAEINSLGHLLQEGDSIIFLHSQTEEGKRCAELLRRYYERQGYKATLREVADLTYQESRFKMRGLRSLVSAMIETIGQEKKRSRAVLVNATGGFKAEIAYATLVGLLLDVPVYYIHEAFRQIIEMPPVPISWDYSLLADNEEFFEWVRADYRPTNEVEERLREKPPEIHLLLIDEDGFTYLSPAGEAFYEAYRYAQERHVSVPLYLSHNALTTYQSLEESLRSLFDRSLGKLRDPLLRRNGSDQVNNCDCLVYPKGHRDERIFWYEQDGSIYVCELARHSNQSYERLIRKGVRSKNYSGFERWPVV